MSTDQTTLQGTSNPQPSSTPLTSDQTITILRRRFLNLGNKIKFINEQGRLVADDPGKLTLFRGMGSTLDDTYGKADTVWNELLEAYVRLGKLDDFPSAKDTANWEAVDRYYYEAKANYLHHTAPLCSTSANMQSGTSTQVSDISNTFVAQGRLPKISLPHFSGQIMDWPLYRDTFLSLVHRDPRLSSIEKYHFLVGSLSGPALSVIKSIPLLESNYDQAWDSLVSAYDNRRRLASAYLNRLINVKAVHEKSNLDSLNNFISVISESVTAFKNLKIGEEAEYILFELAIRSLDTSTRKAFELENAEIEFPTFSRLLTFVKNRHKALSMADCSSNSKREIEKRIYTNVHTPNRYQPNRKLSLPVKRTTLLVNNSATSKVVTRAGTSFESKSSRLSCIICRGGHKLSSCPTFLSSSPKGRHSLLGSWSGCSNCLYPHHNLQECKSKYNCGVCKQRHHTLLHTETHGEHHQTTSGRSTQISDSVPSATSLTCSTPVTDILLGTAQVQVKDRYGRYQVCRIVVDSGSQHSLITEECVGRLGLVPTIFKSNISGVGGALLSNIKGRVQCTLKSRLTHIPTFDMEAVVVSAITQNLPQRPVPPHVRSQYLRLNLADPRFWEPSSVDILLGADWFTHIITEAPLHFTHGGPQAINTIFGYILIGSYNPELGLENSTSLLVTEDVNSLLQRFWEVEEIHTSPLVSPDDEYCERHFQDTHYRLPSGRYVVALPFRESPALGPSRQRALVRTLNLESKLRKNQSLLDHYHLFLKEYLELDHMEQTLNPGEYYIPHHSVQKDDGKLRVVFDASAKTKLGSLNDKLFAGPKLQKDISDILLQFRCHAVVFTADIVKMYRQILIAPNDRKYQHILWRFNLEQPMMDYELKTVTYGVSSSPFLALRVIQQLAQDEGAMYPLAAEAMLSDVYVDDIVTGAANIVDACTLKDQIIDLLSKGCFALSKWASNCPELLKSIPDHSQQPIMFESENDRGLKILGMQWDPQSDIFSYRVSTPVPTVTKRSLLSTIARLYDPLGLVSPVVFFAKLIMQETWKVGVDWDDPVPIQIERPWRDFRADLQNLSSVKIPRYVLTDQVGQFELIGFCDASEKGYCAVIYLHVQQSDGFKVFLLKAKTKLAPIKPLTVPRLELCGALLVTNLYGSIRSFREKLQIERVRFYTDSTVTLGWICTPPYQLKTFVSHRVAKIQELTDPKLWGHVNTVDNPSDLGSRGLLPSEIIENTLWWTGPSWLKQPRSEWPPLSFEGDMSSLPERKSPTTTVLLSDSAPFFITWMERFSTYPKLIRSLAYLLRFLRNTRSTLDKRVYGPIRTSEFQSANFKCISLLQQHFYHANDVALLRLNVFTDERGLLRVGGRIQNAPLSHDQKHPILLPRRCHFNNLLIDYLHKINAHVGVSALQAILQQRYWIPAAKSLIKQRKFKCMICYKVSANSKPPYMADLPKARFPDFRTFHNTGVDFAGPFMYREGIRRNARTLKAYLCLFICLATKAIHLEFVPRLSTEAFLDAFDRFISRRGKPAKMFSDCGTNFVGANNYLREIAGWHNAEDAQRIITNHVAPLGIAWSFNPPHAPHFGGLWEAGVKVAKGLLVRMVGTQTFTETELTTIFNRIEAILNSRPITPISSDPTDLQPLTPGHFLVGGPLTALPEEDLSNLPSNRLSRWQCLRQKVQQFWRRWRREYLQTLQQRNKWFSHQRNLSVGDLVIIKEPHFPILQWPMGRVLEVYKGEDGVVRVVSLRTATGIYKRPVHNLVPLNHS